MPPQRVWRCLASAGDRWLEMGGQTLAICAEGQKLSPAG
jgi:hypothetical protein